MCNDTMHIMYCFVTFEGMSSVSQVSVKHYILWLCGYGAQGLVVDSGCKSYMLPLRNIRLFRALSRGRRVPVEYPFSAL